MNEKMMSLAAERIGISVENLSRELREGTSVVEVAGSRQVDERSLVDAVLAFRVEILELGVRYGWHTRDRAESMRRWMAERLRNQLRRCGLAAPGFRSDAREFPVEGVVAT